MRPSNAFVERLRSAPMSQRERLLAELLRIQRYHETGAEQVAAAALLPARVSVNAGVAEFEAGFATATDALLARCDPAVPADPSALDQDLRTMGALRRPESRAAGRRLHAVGTESDMERALRRCCAARRAAAAQVAVTRP